MAGGKFHVYVWRDPRPGKNNVPIYVGKGMGNRAHKMDRDHNRALAGIVAECVKAGLTITVELVRHFNDEKDAFAYEMELIALYGRRDLSTGTLCNFTAGGDGIDYESLQRIVTTPEWKERQKVGCLKRGKDPEYRAKLINQGLRLAADPEWLAARKASGKRQAADPEWQAKNAAAGRRRAGDPEWRAKQKAGAKRSAADPKRLAKSAIAGQRLSSDPEFAAKMTAMNLRVWADLEKSAKRRAALIARNKRQASDPKWRAKQSAVQRAAWQRRRAAETAVSPQLSFW